MAEQRSIADVIRVITGQLAGYDAAKTVDVLNEGDVDRPCTGIVATFVASCRVLRRATELGANLIVSHEPLYFQAEQEKYDLENDPLRREKRDEILRRGLAVWRFHDYLHRLNPDGIVAGVVEKLGWEKSLSAERPYILTHAPVSLAELCREISERLNVRGLRVVGDESLMCRRIGLAVGAPGWPAQHQLLSRDDVDVLITGECREWETYEYARDLVETGRRKALIVLGHCASEEAGMEYCAAWLRQRLPEVPVHFVAAGVPFRVV